jgi:hypothetical protein
MMTSSDQKPNHPGELGFLETLKSVLWAMLGVRAKGSAQQDFSRGKASHFIIIGILFAVVFILVLVIVVNSVIPA